MLKWTRFQCIFLLGFGTYEPRVYIHSLLGSSIYGAFLAKVLIVPQKEAFAHSFYQRLFSDYPQTQPLFAHTEMKRQEGSLMATLATVVAAVERGDNLVPTLQSLGARHQRYGVQAEHYTLVGAVLLETFYEYLSSAFTPAMQEAWEQAFELISAQMLRGGEPVALPESSDGTVPAE